MRSMVVYFSRAGENHVRGKVESLSVGNTEVLAKMIADLIEAPIFRLELVEAYSDLYADCKDRSKDDFINDRRPEIKAVPDLSTVDVLYLGYPIYWGTMPMPVYTFLDRADMDGMIIRPFCTHEGGGLDRSEMDIRRLKPFADVRSGLAVVGYGVRESRDAVESWVRHFQRRDACVI